MWMQLSKTFVLTEQKFQTVPIWLPVKNILLPSLRKMRSCFPYYRTYKIKLKVLEKGLDFAPIQKKINESELRKNFEEFCRRMRIKCHFRNDVTPQFSEILIFPPKSR